MPENTEPANDDQVHVGVDVDAPVAAGNADAGGEDAGEDTQELDELNDPNAGIDPNTEDADGAAEDDAEEDGEALPDDAPGAH